VEGSGGQQRGDVLSHSGYRADTRIVSLR